jgi:hypothetical protein
VLSKATQDDIIERTEQALWSLKKTVNHKPGSVLKS